MLFNSIEFIVLLLIAFVCYYLPLFKKQQVIILILAGIVFYAWANAWALILLLTSASASFLFTARVLQSEGKRRKIWAVAGVCFNLIILLFFKYSGFLIAEISGLTNNISEFLIAMPLPIGISFYTFHGISMVVDAFKKDGIEIWESKFNYRNSILYTVFFPQLIAGPIMRAKYFLPQIKQHTLKEIQINKCFDNLLLGYFLKMVVADNLKDQTAYFDADYLIASLSTTTDFVLLIGFACQIFADFAGYSYIAKGLAGLFGYNILQNFNYPYIASGFSDFWKRWNISLSQFIKQYVYIPLGGNRKGKLRMYLNLMSAMALAGLWHGAAIGYLLWGLYHGFFICMEKILHFIRLNRFLRFLKYFTVLIVVVFGGILFIFPEPERLQLFLNSFTSNFTLPLHYSVLWFTFIYSMPVFLLHVVAGLRQRNILFRQNFIVIGQAVMLFLIIWNSGTTGTFIYFQF